MEEVRDFNYLGSKLEMFYQLEKRLQTETSNF